MKNECSIVRDILPLYAENMTSPDTAGFVREHLKTCAGCRKEYEHIKEPEAVRPPASAVPLMKLRRKIRAKKIQTALFTAVLVIALLVSAFAFLSAPEFFPYSGNLMSVTENTDNSITITFDEKVTDYSCELYREPGLGTGSGEGYSYHIEAWTSLWDRWFSARGVQSTTIHPKDNLPFTVYYVSNNNLEDVCIYGPSLTENGGLITLPRLALGYYLLSAIACFGILLVLRFVFRRREGVCTWIERIMLYPVSYALGHLCVLGFKTVSYSMQRDFMLILFLSVLIYCGLLLAHNIFRLCRELRDTDEG